MNAKQFKYVLTLASEGSFSKAADVLNIRQPSLSQYIKKIEQEIGFDLFDRTGGNVRLTDAGNAYLLIGRQIVDLEHQLDARLSDIASYQFGTVTVGISAHRSVSLMPEIVKEFRKKYPGILLRIEERKRNEIIDAAEHGEFDLCLTTLPVDEKIFAYQTALVEENVLAIPEHISIGSEQIPNRRFPAVSVKNLDGMDFAVLNEEHPMQKELNDLCNSYGLTLNPTVLCTSLEALLEMAKVGIGAAFIPSCLARPYPGVRYYSIKEDTKRREIVIIHRHEQYLSSPVKYLLDIFLNVLNCK